MPLSTPVLEVTVDGEPTPALAASTSHSVDAPVASATLTFPAPAPSNVVEDASVTIDAGTVEGGTARIFSGRVRGPIDRTLGEGDRTATVRCDGNLWRMALPSPYDLTWVGPIAPRKVIRALLALRGVAKARIEPFVHPTTGVPLLLGGVPWFDAGRVLVPAGTSPLDFISRLCGLFGYRIFDQPDGTVRVARISGRPPEPAFTLEEGVDWLNVSMTTDLHEIVTWWEVQGASGTDLLGQEVAVVSRPKRPVNSWFVPDPPGQVRGTVSDQLLVSQYLADAARVAAELDSAGLAWRVRGEIPVDRLGEMAPGKWCFGATAASVGIDEATTFWRTAVQHEISDRGHWVSIEGWLPRGRTVKEERPPHAKPDGDPSGEIPDYEFDLPPILPPTWDFENPDLDPAPPDFTDDGYDPDEDPDYEEERPDGSPPPPEETVPGALDDCGPAPGVPPRKCLTDTLLETDEEASPEGEEPVTLQVQPPIDGDTVRINGEHVGASFLVRLFRNETEIGSSLAVPAAEEWTAFAATVNATVYAGEILDAVLEEVA